MRLLELVCIAAIATDPAGSAPISGTATWYDDGPGLYAAAGPELRVGSWRGATVTVCHEARCLELRLTDWCACRRRLIDLSPAAFRALGAPLSRGVLAVTVTR